MNYRISSLKLVIMKNLIFLCLSVLFYSNIYAQDISQSIQTIPASFLHLEAGYIYPDGTIRDNIAIRQNISSFYVDQTSDGYISSDNHGLVFGLKYEYYLNKYHIGISTGLRFIAFRSEITGYSSYRSDFFYLRYSMEGSDTKFARVKNISESNNYFSFPVELKWVPYEYLKFQFFARIGAEFSFINILKETTIDFQESAMGAYQNEIIDNLGITTGNFYSSLYGSIGISIGNPNKTRYAAEVFLPSLFLTKDNFTLTDVERYEGFRLSIQVPLLKTK